jgi:hypothetical protein
MGVPLRGAVKITQGGFVSAFEQSLPSPLYFAAGLETRASREENKQ